MILHTASEVISLAKELEDESARFYEKLLKAYTPGNNIFHDFIKENNKNARQIERAYYGTISDAIEGTFAFNLEADNYSLETGLAEGADLSTALNTAAGIEKLIIRFYSDAAGQSQSLMADVPRVFKLLARKREERIEKVEALLKSARSGT